MERPDIFPVPEGLLPLLDQSPVLFAMMEPDGDSLVFHWVGPNIRNLLGYSEQEACAAGWWLENMHPEDRERVEFAFRHALQRRSDRILEYRFADRKGNYRYIRAHVHFPEPAKRQADSTVYQLWTDVTESIRAGERLQALQRAYVLLTGAIEAALTETEPQALYQALCELAIAEGQYQLAWAGLVDEETGDVVPVARAGLNLGYVEQVCATVSAGTPEGRGPVGRAIREGESVISGDIRSDPSMAPWRERALAHGFRSLIALPIRVSGRIIGVFLMYSDQVYDFDRNERELLIQLGNDLSMGVDSLHEKQQRLAAEERLREIAFYDEITGLPKVSQIRESCREQPELLSNGGTCLIIQLERFSEFNHVLGYDYGDRILRTVAERLREHAGENRSVAHVAGAKFLVLAPDCRSGPAARRLAEHLLDHIREPVLVHDLPLEVQAHAGFACAEAGESFEVLFRNADMARVHAGERRLPVVEYESALEMDPGRLQLISDLRHAIERSQLLLHYQPKLDLDNRLVCGAEALVRWQHPDKGLIPPGEFIELAEQTGLITNITLYVVRQGIADARVMRQNGRQLQVAVNVSAADIRKPGFARFVFDCVDEQDMEPGQLTLELTETAMMHDVEQCRATLQELDKAGINIAIDDFGTGYSSLTYLATLPLHSLKIDRSFVQEWQGDSPSRTIVKSTIDMANSLGLRSTAEGVESTEWLADLGKLGCNEAQGFGIARPMTFDSLLKWLSEPEHKTWH